MSSESCAAVAGRARASALGLALLLLLAAVPGRAPAAGGLPVVPAKGQVTLVDLGAKSCIPCKMMAPILEELTREYKGKAAVFFIDVRENHDQVERFGLRAIPTQVFYDKSGREVWRHEGFLDKKAMAERLDRLLAK